ncbi:MAG: sodium/solute symporter [Parvularculaceae bacterium]|nr:sodium/solute symporter [Parvularculaceae bacterium]
MAAFGLLNWAIVAIFMIANLALGFAMSRKVQTAADYHLGARKTPWWAIGVSVIATYVSALSFLGGPAWAYGDGMAALAIHINYPIVIFVVIVVFLPFFFNSGVASIYDYLERRFGPTSRTVISALFLVTQTITSASISTATAVVVTFITGIDVRISIVVMTLIILGYTMLGGMTAVIWTDVLQGVILFIGAGVLLFYLLGAVSPLSGALATLSDAGKLNAIDTSLDLSIAPTVWAGVFAMSLYHITVYGANQMMVQRALAAKSIGDAKKSYLLMGYAAFPIYFLFFFIGALLYVFYDAKPFDQPNEIILIFAQSLAIPGLMGLLAAAILSASMSSLSSALNSLATISVTDFYQRFFRKDASDQHYLAASRWFTVLWAGISIPVAFAFVGSGGSILERLTQVGSYFVGAKLAMFCLGFFSKHTTEKGLLVGVGAGFLALAFVTAGIPALGIPPPDIAWPWYVVIGGGVNIIVSWCASVLISGFQTDWHEQTVIGQIRHFRESGKAEKKDGWYLVPGKIDAACWGLPVFFVATLVFLGALGTLGAR